jgi:hypothetical protein
MNGPSNEECYSAFQALAGVRIDLSGRSWVQERIQRGDFININALLANNLLNQNTGHSLTLTIHGHLATVWPTAREGDKICLMFGGPKILVMREEGDHRVVFGDAGVQGLTMACDIR